MGDKFVGLIRVSTDRQGQSGLGLEAGLADVTRYVEGQQGEMVEVFTEVESGTHDDLVDRPTLQRAVALCKRRKAILLVPNLTRLTRSTLAMADIKRSGIRFRACDNPDADELSVDINVAVAAKTARDIRANTSKALKAYKDGKRVSKRMMALLTERYQGNVPQAAIDAVAGKLGAALVGSHLTDEQRAKGQKMGNAKQADQARDAYSDLLPRMREMKAEGATLAAIAETLNADGHRTRGHRTHAGAPFAPVTVMRILARAGAAAKS